MAEEAQTSELFLLMLKQWTEAKAALEHFKELELRLRNGLVEEAFPKKKALAEGTFKHQLPHGWSLDMSAKVNVTIDEAVLISTLQLLRDNDIDDALIFGTKPTFIKAGYKELSVGHKKLVQTALTFKDGTPTLSLVAPKEKAKDTF